MGDAVTTTQAAAVMDRLTAQRITERFNVVFDLNMPVWRFQLQGPQAWAEELALLHRGGEVRIDILRTVPTSTGFATEHEEHEDVDGEDLSARRLWLCEVRDERIAEVVGYCSGEWDEALRARHAAEAPMVRP
jgi:ketosteroid isomerase-like protein